MSYDHTLLFDSITLTLQLKPWCSLEGLSRELQVSPHTIKNAIKAATGKKLRDLRDELLFEKVKSVLILMPTATIKQLSSEAGYRSPRAFARAVRRAYGISPEQLRARVAKETAKKT